MNSDPLVLVLGAGASYGARPLSPVRPPLGSRLASYLSKWLRANDPNRSLRIADPMFHPPVSRCPFYTGEELWRQKPLADVTAALERIAGAEAGKSWVTGTPFERLMDSWANSKVDRSDHILCTQRVLALSMLVGRACAFHSAPDLFDVLLSRLTASRKVVIVTLNYDLLIEDALGRAGRAYTYPCLPGVQQTIFTSAGAGDPVPIYKPHGSINWFSVRGIGHSADLETARKNSRPTRLVRVGGLIGTQTYATYVPPDRINTFYSVEQSVELDGPVAAVYGSGKPALKNPEHVAGHRSDCLAALRSLSQADVLIIGVRAVTQDDDPTADAVIKTLGALRGSKTYVGPTSSDCEAFAKAGFVTERVTFEHWAQALSNRPSELRDDKESAA